MYPLSQPLYSENQLANFTSHIMTGNVGVFYALQIKWGPCTMIDHDLLVTITHMQLYRGLIAAISTQGHACRGSSCVYL